MQEYTACFFGHRTIDETEDLKRSLTAAIENLITAEGVDTFLFGSKSRFDSLCLELVTAFKEKYPHLKRVYVRAEYPEITETYKAYLLRSYEDTYYPEKLRNAGKAAYVERNRELIDRSRFCIVYYSETHSPATRKSGTKLALDYAMKKGNRILLFPNEKF